MKIYFYYLLFFSLKVKSFTNWFKNINNDLYNGECILPLLHNKLNLNNGFDQRHNISITNTKIETIQEYFFKMNIISILENKNISYLTKVELIENYDLLFNSISKYNIYAGGLLDDWIG